MAARLTKEVKSNAPSPSAIAPATAAVPAGDAERERARRLAAAAPPKLRLGYAQSFCRHVLSRYWDKRPCGSRALRPAPIEVAGVAKREALELAEQLADVAASMTIDAASYLVGRTYAAMLPDELRAENGVFYTPPPVVDRLLDVVEKAGVDWSRCRVLEPACGGGAFLGPLARRMLRTSGGAERRIVHRNLVARLAGYELDPFAAWMSTVFLDATVHDAVGFTFEEPSASIEVCDSLTRAEGDSFDLVIANPPYGRVKLGVEQRATFKRSLFGHANLYGLFLDLAVRRAKPGALIAYVTPTGFLCGEYFKSLRALLASEAPPVAMDFICERAGVFDDVLQETLLAVFRKGEPRKAVSISFVEHTASGLTVVPGGEALLPPAPDQPWIVARTPDDVEFAERLRALPTRLSDWGYRVSTGPLVWNRHKDQLSHRQAKGSVPVLWAEAVGADGTFEFRAARRNHSPYFTPKVGDDWLLIRKPCVLLQRTTAKEQARRLIAAALPSEFLEEHEAVTVENHLNMVVPTSATPAVDSKALAAFLNSAAADRAFRCISGTVAVSAYELEGMPLPPAWALRGLAELLNGQHTPGVLEGYCARLYGDK